MIRLIQYWNLYYVDDDRNTHKVSFQTWLNEISGEKEYWLFKPPKYNKQIVTKERGNRYFPVTDKSQDVLNCFKNRLNQLNVKISMF